MQIAQKLKELRTDTDKSQKEIAKVQGKKKLHLQQKTECANVANKCLENKQCFATFATKKPFI